MLYPSLSFRNSGPWTPAQLTTALWLDAADVSTVTTVSGAVSQWDDKSGNNLHAVQNTAGSRPTYTSGVSVNFDGTKFLQSPLNINGWSGITVFWVVKPNNTNHSYLDIGYGSSSGQSGLLAISGGVIWSFDGRPSGGEYFTAKFSGTNTSRILGFGSYDLSSLKASYNGGSEISVSVSSPHISAGSNTNIGALMAAPFFQFYNNTQENEILVFPSVLSAENKQKTEGYLAHKWGLVGNLPATHPYKNQAP